MQKVLVAGLATAAIAVTVPALAAGAAPAGPQVSVAGHRYFVDAGSLRQTLAARIDAAVAAGWLPPRLAARLKQQLAAAERLLRQRGNLLAGRAVTLAAKALRTTPTQLRAEIRAGLTLRHILLLHGGSLLDRLDDRLGQALGTGRLSLVPVNAIVAEVERRVDAALDRSLAPQG